MALEAVDRTLSITQLEGDDWGDAPPGAAHLVTTVHRLRHKPLEALDAGDYWVAHPAQRSEVERILDVVDPDDAGIRAEITSFRNTAP
ncbi:hypothetical protein [Pseudonocardia zijingensis]|jgi:hypothetical protein|uniref:Uncharacterized protein n=1 Tax=Pseudonocardia zijingensis TaxID=153376 RepID=A0ABP3YL23_9PSEU